MSDQYRYVLVITGELDAKDVNHARLQIEMGFTLTGRMLKTPHEISIQVVPEVEPSSDNGRIPLSLMKQERKQRG